MDEVEEQDVEEEEFGGSFRFGVIFVTDCLFCFYYLSFFVKNVVYMIKVYSFFIFDIEYFFDFKGLIKYLGRYSSFIFSEEISYYWRVSFKGILVLCFLLIFDLIICLFCED